MFVVDNIIISLISSEAKPHRCSKCRVTFKWKFSLKLHASKCVGKKSVASVRSSSVSKDKPTKELNAMKTSLPKASQKLTCVEKSEKSSKKPKSEYKRSCSGL